MKFAKVFFRASFLIFSALCLLIFQLGTSVLTSNSSASANQPFPTVVPVDPDFEAPIEDEILAPTPIPTIGPGSAFDQVDPNRPKEKFIEEGDARFGYGPMAGSDDLYVVWTTDDTGTHYLVVHEDSDYLRGTRDSATGGRHGNGFDSLVKQREAEKIVRDEEIAIMDSRDSSAERSFSLGLGIALVGGIVCMAATLGVCAPIIAVGGGFVLAAFASQDSARSHDASARVHGNAVREMERRLSSRANTYSQGDVMAPAGGG